MNVQYKDSGTVPKPSPIFRKIIIYNMCKLIRNQQVNGSSPFSGSQKSQAKVLTFLIFRTIRGPEEQIASRAVTEERDVRHARITLDKVAKCHLFSYRNSVACTCTGRVGSG